MDVHDAIAEFMASKRGKTFSTQKQYHKLLSAFESWCTRFDYQLEDITRARIREFMDWIACKKTAGGEPIKASTVNHYATALKIFFTWCARDEDYSRYVTPSLARSIVYQVQELAPIAVYSRDEIRTMLTAARKQPYPWLGLRDTAVILVLLDTGIRAAELCVDPSRPEREPTGLLLENISLDPNDAFIRVMGKGRKIREVGLGEEARRALKRYLRDRPHTSPFVFVSRTGEPLTVNGLAHLMDRISDATGIDDIHPHKFRHTFAVNYLLAGGDLYRLSRLLGHTSVKMTERYLRAIDNTQARSGYLSVADSLM